MSGLSTPQIQNASITHSRLFCRVSVGCLFIDVEWFFFFTPESHISPFTGWTAAPTDVHADVWVTFTILPHFQVSTHIDSVKFDFTIAIFISLVTRQLSILRDWVKRVYWCYKTESDTAVWQFDVNGFTEAKASHQTFATEQYHDHSY